MDTYQAVRG